MLFFGIIIILWFFKLLGKSGFLNQMTLSEVKAVENIYKSLHNFLDTSPVEKEVFLPYKVQHHGYEY